MAAKIDEGDAAVAVVHHLGPPLQVGSCRGNNLVEMAAEGEGKKNKNEGHGEEYTPSHQQPGARARS